MKLSKARVRNYRSIRDTGWFDIEDAKTILVGPNEAGKSALLQALQQVNAPKGIKGFDALRDYPRALFNEITTGKVNPAKLTVVEVVFSLDADDQAALPNGFQDCTYTYGRHLDNSAWHHLNEAPASVTYGSLRKDLLRLAAHVDARTSEVEESAKPSVQLATITNDWDDAVIISDAYAESLSGWLDRAVPYVDESNATEEGRLDRLGEAINSNKNRSAALVTLAKRRPIFVLFSNYFRVRPLIHLEHLATRIETKVLDDEQYDYGNQCLLKLLGFSAKELSDLGKATEPAVGDKNAFNAYRNQLDKRSYQLNAASVRLTDEIRSVWLPDPDRAEADRLRIQADGQYLKVVVEDDLGVEIELDQRSEGFQWLVSFFVVFFAEAAGVHRNAILLLDEPGLSLHALKQRDFRGTISRLAGGNQTIYTTHSPFLVGPNELDLVRVVEMADRTAGTKVHTSITASDSAALLPLQEALGYDLAQSLFAQQRNLVLEGLTDYWYLDAVAELLRDGDVARLNNKVALIPANSAGKVVYFATILYAQNLKVAALLDSDGAGDQAAQQETLVHTLGNKCILRTKDFLIGSVAKSEIEDLLRETLVDMAKSDLGWDISSVATTQPARPIVDIFTKEIKEFSKYRLAKAFLRWTQNHEATDLTKDERNQWSNLLGAINKALK